MDKHSTEVWEEDILVLALWLRLDPMQDVGRFWAYGNVISLKLLAFQRVTTEQ